MAKHLLDWPASVPALPSHISATDGGAQPPILTDESPVLHQWEKATGDGIGCGVATCGRDHAWGVG